MLVSGMSSYGSSCVCRYFVCEDCKFISSECSMCFFSFSLFVSVSRYISTLLVIVITRASIFNINPTAWTVSIRLFVCFLCIFSDWLEAIFKMVGKIPKHPEIKRKWCSFQHVHHKLVFATWKMAKN